MVKIKGVKQIISVTWASDTFLLFWFLCLLHKEDLYHPFLSDSLLAYIFIDTYLLK